MTKITFVNWNSSFDTGSELWQAQPCNHQTYKEERHGLLIELIYWLYKKQGFLWTYCGFKPLSIRRLASCNYMLFGCIQLFLQKENIMPESQISAVLQRKYCKVSCLCHFISPWRTVKLSSIRIMGSIIVFSWLDLLRLWLFFLIFVNVQVNLCAPRLFSRDNYLILLHLTMKVTHRKINLR